MGVRAGRFLLTSGVNWYDWFRILGAGYGSHLHGTHGTRVPPKPQQHPPWQDPSHTLCWISLVLFPSYEDGKEFGLLCIQSLGLLRTQPSPGAEQPVTVGSLASSCFIKFSGGEGGSTFPCPVLVERLTLRSGRLFYSVFADSQINF